MDQLDAVTFLFLSPFAFFLPKKQSAEQNTGSPIPRHPRVESEGRGPKNPQDSLLVIHLEMSWEKKGLLVYNF